MPDKQKVTLYIPDELHRQFKIRSAVDGETMSSMAQRALEFYLAHSDLVQNGVARHGKVHQIHSCPQCDASVMLSGSDLRLVYAHADCIADDLAERDLTGLERMPAMSNLSQGESSVEHSSIEEPLLSPGADSRSPDEGELITC